jgi:uncharacterized protein YchJ
MTTFVVILCNCVIILLTTLRSSSCFSMVNTISALGKWSHDAALLVPRRKPVHIQPPMTFHLAKDEARSINERDNDDNDILSNPKSSKGGKKKKPKPSGFGSVSGAMVNCPCTPSSGLSYHKCCYILHTDPNLYANASASQVVRARYTAYAHPTLIGTQFLLSSTHPNHKDYTSLHNNFDQFHRDITNSNYKLVSCQILDEKYYFSSRLNSTATNDYDKKEYLKSIDVNVNDRAQEEAVVKFIVQMTSGNKRHNINKKIGFMETSTFRRTEINGPWLYLDGIVEDVAL